MHDGFTFRSIRRLPRGKLADIDNIEAQEAAAHLVTGCHPSEGALYDKNSCYSRTHSDALVKQVGESWEEYSARKAKQREFLRGVEVAARQAANEERACARARELQSRNTLAVVQNLSDAEAATYLPASHGLYEDFITTQKMSFNQARQIFCDAEACKRRITLLANSLLREGFRAFSESFQRIHQLWEASVAVATAACELRREEERRKREEFDRAERQRLIALHEAAEKTKREMAEEAKRIERKRKEEERRARARSLREAKPESEKDDDSVPK